ncbi:transglycosylase domain-containing protein [Kribbella sp. VKM Ac-2566]|uniref:transglycosylase domain-containing protein n=1 Tax=Kribbella sp. VKM Ac-2566 TaxID=2512218 RepID=UPI001062446A|nr:transglycosylase domain-containing protein [Kribbella sp. VKM Ac-2566]TDW92463.1 membrane peptidoglycan carboxypeptidase [Kribbella sp. VKM Ac-2566]
MHRGERRAKRPNVVWSVFVFLVVSALAGALTAGLALPFAGLAGVTTAKAHDTVQYLPQDLQTAPLAQKSIIQDADGKTIATLYQQNRTPVSLKAISPLMLKAIVAIEDDRFYEHGALDFKGTLRALLRNQSSGGVQQGGSSITQQYVKLSLINKARTPEEVKDATAETYERKIAELRYAIAVEKEIPKTEILNRYLNLAFFGDRSYGVEAAAMHYFGVHAAKLTLPQAAMLAGLVKNPSGYDPIDSPVRAKARRDVVLRRMNELNIITAKQAQDAIRTPVIDPKKVRVIPSGCANSTYPFFCEYVVSKLKANNAFGKTPEERENYIETAGLVIKTSLDRKIQAAAQTAIAQHSKTGDQAVAAITMVEPGTGLVKAMAQSRTYGGKKGQTAYNYNVEKSYAGGFGGFQNGSTMKAFTIAAAIGKGVPTTYRIRSPQTISLGGQNFSTCNGPISVDSYTPKNSTKTVLDPSMVDAARASTNTYFLQLSQQIGLCPITTIASQLGMYDAQTLKPLQQVVSFTLGSAGLITPLMLSNAYATFAARGMYCNPQIITSIASLKTGKAIPTPGPNCHRVLSPGVADGVNYVLQQVMAKGGTGGKLKFGKSDLAGKTGTIDENQAVWFAGYSSKLAAASVVADADPPASNLINQVFNGKKLEDASGSGTAGPIWKSAMQAALQGLPTTKFVKADDKIIRGNVKDLPYLKGMTPADAGAKLLSMGFKVQMSHGPQVDSDAPAGTVAWTNPRQEDGAPEGATVLLYISNGSKAKPTPPPVTPPTPPVTPPTVKPPPGFPTCPPWDPRYPKCKGR